MLFPLGSFFTLCFVLCFPVAVCLLVYLVPICSLLVSMGYDHGAKGVSAQLRCPGAPLDPLFLGFSIILIV